MIRQSGLLALLAFALRTPAALAQPWPMEGSSGMDIERLAQVEMVKGEKIGGKLRLGSIAIETDAGRYQIAARKLKTIRLTGSAVKSENGGGGLMGIQGTVFTTTGKEISGSIYIPNWTLAIEDGTLTLAPEKLRTITFMAEPRLETSIKPDTDVPGPKAKTLRSSDSEKGVLKIETISGPNVVALSVTGPKVTRIAASSAWDGVWETQDLREPAEGTVSPIIGPGIAVYGIGRFAYAYISESHRWGVLELPEGSQAMPFVGTGWVTVRDGNHIYTFTGKGNKWEHVDLRALLDADRATPSQAQVKGR